LRSTRRERVRLHACWWRQGNIHDEPSINASTLDHPRTPAAPARVATRKQLTLAATILVGMAFIDGSVVNIALPAIQQALQADAASRVDRQCLLVAARRAGCCRSSAAIFTAPADFPGRHCNIYRGLYYAATLARHHGARRQPRVQGLGAALLIPASLACLSTFDDRERKPCDRTWRVSRADAAAGPVLGGWLVDQVSWRAIFLLNVPLAVAAAGLAVFFVGESRDEKQKPLDWKGAVAVSIGLAAITWDWAPFRRRDFRTKPCSARWARLAFLICVVAIEAAPRTRDDAAVRCTARAISPQPTP